jgi:hypothetical protein
MEHLLDGNNMTPCDLSHKVELEPAAWLELVSQTLRRLVGTVIKLFLTNGVEKLTSITDQARSRALSDRIEYLV